MCDYYKPQGLDTPGYDSPIFSLDLQLLSGPTKGNPADDVSSGALYHGQPDSTYTKQHLTSFYKSKSP